MSFGRLVVPALALTVLLTGVASAHFAGFTSGGDDDYFCTLADGGHTADTCGYDGDRNGCFAFGCEIFHSYGFQSVGNQMTTDRVVGTIICSPNYCFEDHGKNFRRLCWPGWGVDLNCHDQDGVSHLAYIMNWSGASAVVKGNPWW